MARLLVACIGLVCTALLQGCSTTMLTASCDDPKVSNSSVPFVYLVMLPYVYRGTEASSDAYSSAVDVLNDVARLQAVRMGAETTDMHVTLLRDSGNGCAIESVYKIFTEKRFFERELQSTVVFYWGDVFETKDRVLIQSHLRTLWKNPKENLINVDVALPSDRGHLRFTGWIPYATVTFPSRSLPIGSQRDGSNELRMSLDARSVPANAGDKVPLPKNFIIQRREGDWVELHDARSARTVWVAVTDPGTNAKSLLPELSFAHALSAYANYSRVARSDIADNAIDWLDDFRNAYDSRQSSEALRHSMAVADVVEAVLRLDRKRVESERRRANELIDKAVAALPTNSAVLNLAAILKIEQCCATKDAAAEIQRRLEMARRLDAGNEIIAKNLLNWYLLLEEKDVSVWPETREETRRRAAQLAAALK